MKIILANTRFYYLTVPQKNNIRKQHLLREFKDYLLTEINPVPLTRFDKKLPHKKRKQKSGATGFLRILDKAVQDQIPNTIFQPFVIIEDDITCYRSFPEKIEIPDDCDMLYIGISSWGMAGKPKGQNNCVCYSSVPDYDEVIRIFNMLSTHGLIICSLRGLLVFQKCLMEDFQNARGYDISITQMQPHIKAYALKQPLVYQNATVGGEEKQTKITYQKFTEKPLPKAWMNRKLIAFLSNHAT